MADASLKHFEPLITDRIRLTISRMEEESKIRGAADVFKWWTFMTTDVIGELSFGESFRMVEYGKVCNITLCRSAPADLCRKTSTS